MPRPAATPYLSGENVLTELNSRDTAVLDYVDERTASTTLVDRSPTVGGAGNFPATHTIVLDGTERDVICGGILTQNTVIDVTGTFAWGCGITFRVAQNATGGFTLTFRRAGSSVSPSLRWGGGAPSPVIVTTANAIEMYVALASPGGNMEMTKMSGPFT